MDKDFLKDLDEFRNREVYARITALSKDELPLERIEGKITGGSINIDGASTIRRTCSLSMVAEDVNINEFYWGLYNKFKLEVGLKNTVKETWGDKYPDDIIWFKQGIYVITGFNTSLSASNYTISINGKDKMCLLNGEVGGSLPASIDFGKEEYVDLDEGTITYTQIPIKKIIRESLHAYAMEPYHNIIINDLDESGLELLEYRGDTPAYLFYDIKKSEYDNITFDGEFQVYDIIANKWINIKDIPVYNARIDTLIMDEKATKIKRALEENSEEYTVAKLEYGQTAGYKITDLVYSGDLISNIGESLTSIYDKIVSMLGEFEYFYDLDGRFVFQKKHTYVNTSWNNLVTTEEDTYAEASELASEFIYSFEGNNLISSFSNNPNLNNLRNDFSIWGTRKSVNDAEIPVHYRYAIHEKPARYKPVRPFYEEYGVWIQETKEWIPADPEKEKLVRYGSKEDLDKYGGYEDTQVWYDESTGKHVKSFFLKNDFEFNVDDYDWRELIYQMALDYYKCDEKGILIPSNENNVKYFPLQLAIIQKNPWYPTGYTGYEQFYSDMQGFWRDLYDPVPPVKYVEYQPEKDGEIFEIDKKVYLQEYYREANASDDKNKIFTFNEDGSISYLIDDIELNWDFDNNGNQKKPEWYITSKGGYTLVTQSMVDNNLITRQELYYYGKKEGEEEKSYLHILDKKASSDKQYYFAIKQLKEFGENGKLASYSTTYTQRARNLKGEATDEKYKIKYYIESCDYYDDTAVESKYWNIAIKESPDLLNFWIDFLDDGELNKFSINAIGDRPKVVNDKDVKSIYYKDIPNLIFTTLDQLEALDLKSKTGYTFMYMPNTNINDTYYYAYFSISAQGKSAKDKLDELLYNHSYCTESVTISAIPIYYLEPNYKIQVRDEKSKINGEYVVSKISLPLTYNGTMSITATKAPQKIY